MRIPLATVPLVLLALPGCLCALLCPPGPVRWFEPRRETPEVAYETFVRALELGAPEVIYESLGPEFMAHYGVPGIGKFKQGYQVYRSDFDELAGLLRSSEKPAVRYFKAGERLGALVTLRSGASTGEFVLLDQPSWSIATRIEGYDPEDVTYYLTNAELAERVVVRDGLIGLGPLDARDLGVMDPSEVLRLTVGHRWLLADIRKLENAEALLGRFGEIIEESKPKEDR